LFCNGLCVINWRVSKTERKPRRHVIGRRGTIETRWSRAETRNYFSRAFRSRPLVNLAPVRLENSHAHRAGPRSAQPCDFAFRIVINATARG